MTIQITTINEILVVDSRLIAEELGIQHETFMRTIKKYLDEIQEFGHLRFENATVQNSVGAKNTVVFCYLNEDQATYAMTLSRNTDKVRLCKRNLVKAFSEAKKVIQTVIPQQSDRIKELELQNELMSKELEMRHLDNTMLQLHGKETVLTLRGYGHHIVETEKPTIEVIDDRHNVKFKGQTLKQIAEYLTKKTGRKFKNGGDVKRELKRLGLDHLICSTPRSVVSEYVPDENLESVYRALDSGNRQLLLGQ